MYLHLEFPLFLFTNCIIIKIKIEKIYYLKYLKILYIWSISESPGKSGYFVIISTKIHPADHISIGVLYSIEPNKISGLLYHKVTTFGKLENYD